MTDHRPSSTLNLFYDNKTVPASLQGKWTNYGVVLAYLFGNPRQVLFTGLGYLDFISQFGQFPFDVVVPLDLVEQPTLRDRTWQGVLKEWVGILIEDVVENVTPEKGDVLLIHGIHVGSSAADIRRARKLATAFNNAGASILQIVETGQRLPTEMVVLDGRAGAYSDISNAFMLQAVDGYCLRRASRRIFIFGDNNSSLIGTALGAVDHWLRRPGVGKDLLNQYAPRVIVDSQSPALSHHVASYSDALLQLGIPFLASGTLLFDTLNPSPDQLQLHPVQKI
jgi:hypothetical protein